MLTLWEKYKFDFYEINGDSEDIENPTFLQKISDYVKVLNFPRESTIIKHNKKKIQKIYQNNILMS